MNFPLKSPKSIKNPPVLTAPSPFPSPFRLPFRRRGAVAMVSGAQGEGVGEATAQPTVKTRTKVPKAAKWEDPWMIIPWILRIPWIIIYIYRSILSIDTIDN